jgi:pimeloyl-ACP methyl ester carboxylesterase/quercetin dioxygenase-like cupin family protein
MWKTLRAAVVFSWAVHAALADGNHDHGHAHPAQATPVVEELPARIVSDGTVLHGSWLFPDADSEVPCVILVGGTLSQTRDGGFAGGGPAGAQRDALGRMARQLAAAGYATLRWDKRGHGETDAATGATTNETERDDVVAAISAARAHPRITRVIVAGESAGGYFACLAAERGVRADGYVFLGCLASTSKRLFEYNFGRLAEWAAANDENRDWARAHALHALATGHHVEALFRAAETTDDATFTFAYADRAFTRSLLRIRTETRKPPAELFRLIDQPSLIVQGAGDMNVPPDDAATIERVLKESGVKDVRRVMIPLVDHNFQYVAQSLDERMRDRHGFTSFYRLYSPRVYTEIIDWLRARFPSPVPARTPVDEPRPGIVHWDGIQVIEDISDLGKNPGVDTLEGRVGPLMNGAHGQARFFVLPAGLYLAEHPHASESIIYTVSGNYVLCSGGRRQLMKPGSLFWFKAHAPTGWEVPFDQPAHILIFKAPRSDWSDARFWEYLYKLAEHCRQENAKGVPFRFHELPANHPARAFARRINPKWERKLPAGPAGQSGISQSGPADEP